jgi:hypothetical protein
MTKDEAITAAARILASACAERDQLAAEYGAAAVARAAHYPGHAKSPDEIEAHYNQLHAAPARAA